MPTVPVPGKDIQFFFTDTGAPAGLANYTTLILVHGHTYHSAVFQKLLPLAASRSLRILCINRRDYPGSTPHSPEEFRIYASGSDQERIALINEAGLNLALAVDGIIQQCNLPSSGVALAGWSLGNVFTLAAMASILSLSQETIKRLQSSIKTIILWDPPRPALGIAPQPNEYLPLFDQDLTPAARGPAFGKWVASYFKHGDRSTRDPSQLTYTPDPSRKATFEDVPFEDLRNLVDLTVADKCDTIILQPPFASVLSSLINKALFDPEIRTPWKGTKVVHLYGKAASGLVQFAAWDIESRVERAKGNAPITFRPIENANHFVMWENPGLTLDELIGCMET